MSHPSLPPQTHAIRSIRYQYEAFMSRAIPGTLALASLYLLSAGYEFVLVPWLGRTAWMTRGLMCWSGLLLTAAWYSYYLARTTDAGSVPAELGEHMRQLPASARTSQNWCTQCESVKPPRAHHCRRCRKCTLRMDSHCVALNNCVGLFNWKYFVSAWFYMFLSSVNGLVILAIRFSQRPYFEPDTPERLHCIIFTCLCAFLAWISFKHANMNINLALLNLTAIEYMGLPAYISLNFCQRYGVAWSRISNFDKGWRHNLIMILGEPILTWFMPWVAPRSPWGPHPVTWYSGFSVQDLYAPPTATPRRDGNQVNAHNHDLSARNGWNMWDDPVQHAAEGLRATNLKGKGSLPLIAYQNGDGSISHSGQEGSHPHAHGGEDDQHNHGHSHGGDMNGHNHSHGGGGDDGHHGHSHDGGHNHSHGGDDDEMPALLSDEELMEMGGHQHSHGHGGSNGHNHSHGNGDAHNHAH